MFTDVLYLNCMSVAKALSLHFEKLFGYTPLRTDMHTKCRSNTVELTIT